MKFKRNQYFNFIFFLGIYHLFFVFLTYNYLLKNGGDAFFYWFQTNSTDNKPWFDFFGYGTDSVLFLNYPLVHWFSIPLFWGFVLYGFIGFLGFIQLYRLALLMMENAILPPYTKYLLYAFLLLPNTHFWTAMIGKEALIFTALATLFLKAYQQKYSSLLFIVSFLLIFIVRPHVGFMFVLSFGIVLLFSSKLTIKKKIISLATTLALLSLSFYMFLQLSEIKRLDWSRIERFNLGSLRSFEGSGSFVPMETYTVPMKLFSFYFRPFFENSTNFYYLILSIENLFTLCLLLAGIVALLYFKRKIKNFEYIAFLILFCLLAGLLFTQRYAGLGIFVRTKIMFLPFLCVTLISVINIYWNERSTRSTKMN